MARTADSSNYPPAADDVVCIRNWPLRDDRLAAVLVLVAAAGVAAGVGILSSSIAAGGLALFALLISLWRLWLPVKFEIGPRGLAQQVLGWRRLIVWRNIPRVEVRSQGMVFHASSTPSRFALLRSIYIRDHGHREQLLKIIQHYAVEGSRRGSSIR